MLARAQLSCIGTDTLIQLLIKTDQLLFVRFPILQIKCLTIRPSLLDHPCSFLRLHGHAHPKFRFFQPQHVKISGVNQQSVGQTAFMIFLTKIDGLLVEKRLSGHKDVFQGLQFLKQFLRNSQTACNCICRSSEQHLHNGFDAFPATVLSIHQVTNSAQSRNLLHVLASFDIFHHCNILFLHFPAAMKKERPHTFVCGL